MAVPPEAIALMIKYMGNEGSVAVSDRVEIAATIEPTRTTNRWEILDMIGGSADGARKRMQVEMAGDKETAEVRRH